MADKKISELPLAGALGGSEEIAAVQGGVTKRASIGLIKDYIVANHDHAASAIENDSGVTGTAVSDALDTLAAGKQPANANLDGFAGKAVPSGVVVGTSDSQALANKSLVQPELILKQSVAAAPTGEGVVEWDTNDSRLKIGDGAATKSFSDDSVNAASYAAVTHMHTMGDVSDAGALATKSTVSSADIDDASVTLAKQANIASQSILGRSSGGSGVPEVLDASSVRGILGVSLGAEANSVDDVFGATGNVDIISLGENVSPNSNDWVVIEDNVGGTFKKVQIGNLPGGGGSVTSVFARSGDVTAAASDYDASQIDNDSSVGGADVAAALDSLDTGKADAAHSHTAGAIVAGTFGTGFIADGAITNAKQADMAANTIKGRITASTGAPEDLTAANLRSIINVADGASANDTDANLKARANHTGTQAMSTISDAGALATLDTIDAAQISIASQAQGDILYRGASGWARLGAGTSGQVLETQGAGANPQWVTPAGGSGAWSLVSSASASSSASVDFTSGITSANDLYMLVGTSIVPATDNTDLYLRVSVSSAFIAADNSYHWQYDEYNPGSNWTATVNAADNGTGGDGYIQLLPGLGNDASETTSVVIYIHTPASAGETAVTWDGRKQSPKFYQGRGYPDGTSVIDGFQFLMSSGNIASGDFALYKLAKS